MIKMTIIKIGIAWCILALPSWLAFNWFMSNQAGKDRR